MPRKPTMTPGEFATRARLLSFPTSLRILLELAEAPRDTTALHAAVGGAASSLGSHLTLLRYAGLVETTPAGQWRIHSLTPLGRAMAGAIATLSR